MYFVFENLKFIIVKLYILFVEIFAEFQLFTIF